MCLERLDKDKDHGLFVLRLGIGAIFVYFGYGKLLGGPAMWEKIGGALGFIGINFGQQFFGFLAVLSEFGGGLLLILGLMTRVAAIFLFITMCVAANMHFAIGDGFQKAFPAIESAIIFFSLIFIGPGKFSLDEKCAGLCGKKIK